MLRVTIQRGFLGCYILLLARTSILTTCLFYAIYENQHYLRALASVKKSPLTRRIHIPLILSSSFRRKAFKNKNSYLIIVKLSLQSDIIYPLRTVSQLY